MEYRTNRRTGDKFSEIGIGTAEIGFASHDEAIAALCAAYDRGVRVVDLAGGHQRIFDYVGEAFEDVRDQMIYQVHYGANYEQGDYGWTTNLNKVKEQTADMMKRLRTDYIDYGFIHCLDEDKDLDAYIKGVSKAVFSIIFLKNSKTEQSDISAFRRILQNWLTGCWIRILSIS